MDYIKIKITKGIIDNSYIDLNEHIKFFPKKSLGGKNKSSIGKEVKFDVGFGNVIFSDIDSHKRIIRNQLKQFFSNYIVKENDFISIYKLNDFEYKIRPHFKNKILNKERIKQIKSLPLLFKDVNSFTSIELNQINEIKNKSVKELEKKGKKHVKTLRKELIEFLKEDLIEAFIEGPQRWNFSENLYYRLHRWFINQIKPKTKLMIDMSNVKTPFFLKKDSYDLIDEDGFYEPIYAIEDSFNDCHQLFIKSINYKEKLITYAPELNTNKKYDLIFTNSYINTVGQIQYEVYGNPIFELISKLLSKNGKAIIVCDQFINNKLKRKCFKEYLDKMGLYINYYLTFDEFGKTDEFISEKDTIKTPYLMTIIIEKKKNEKVYVKQLNRLFAGLEKYFFNILEKSNTKEDFKSLLFANYETPFIDFDKQQKRQDLKHGIRINRNQFINFKQIEKIEKINDINTSYTKFEEIKFNDVCKKIKEIDMKLTDKKTVHADIINLHDEDLSNCIIFNDSFNKYPFFNIPKSETTNTAIICFLDETKILADFVFLFFSNKLGKIYLESSFQEEEKNDSFKRIDFDLLTIPLPPIDIQKQLIDSFIKINELKTSINELDSDLTLNPKSLPQLEKILDDAMQGFNKITIPEKIKSIVRKEESISREFKASFFWDMNKNTYNKEMMKVVIRAIASFLNAKGGDLIIGVDDTKTKIIGIEKDLLHIQRSNKNSSSSKINDIFKNRFANQLNQYFDAEIINDNINYNIHEVDEKKVFWVEIKKSNTPCYVDKVFYCRTGDITKELKGQDLVRYVMDRFEKNKKTLI